MSAGSQLLFESVELHQARPRCCAKQIDPANQHPAWQSALVQELVKDLICTCSCFWQQWSCLLNAFHTCSRADKECWSACPKLSLCIELYASACHDGLCSAHTCNAQTRLFVAIQAHRRDPQRRHCCQRTQRCWQRPWMREAAGKSTSQTTPCSSSMRGAMRPSSCVTWTTWVRFRF